MEEPTYLMEELPSGQWTVDAAFSLELAGESLEWEQWLKEQSWN